MNFRIKQGLIFGLIAGVALFAFFYAMDFGAVSFILIPVGIILGVAPELTRQKEEE